MFTTFILREKYRTVLSKMEENIIKFSENSSFIKFIEEDKDKYKSDKNCITKFLSRKYKCVIIWLISIISMSEMIYLILQKSSDTVLSEVFQKYLNISYFHLSQNKIN